MDFDPSSLPPEALAALLQLGGLDEQNAGLEQQLQSAQSLQKPSGREYRTGGGAALGGIADIINTLSGASQQRQLEEQQAQLRQQKLAGRKTFAGLLGFGGGPTPPPMPFGYAPAPDEGPLQAPVPFGYASATGGKKASHGGR